MAHTRSMVEYAPGFAPRQSRHCFNRQRATSRRELQELCRGVAEVGALLIVTEGSAGEDVIHRVELPRIGIVAAQHDLARPDLGHEMADPFGPHAQASK